VIAAYWLGEARSYSFRAFPIGSSDHSGFSVQFDDPLLARMSLPRPYACRRIYHGNVPQPAAGHFMLVGVRLREIRPRYT